jgi:hypothetical protein
MNKSYSKIRHIQESNLKLEKRIIFEQEQTVQRTHADSQLVDKVFANIKAAMSGLGTDEDALLSALYKLAPNTSGAGWKANVEQKRKDYEYLMQLIRKEGFKTIYEWLKTDLSNVHRNPDPVGVSKAFENDLKVLDYAAKLEDLLTGRNDYL